jgi:hypothetical protein
VSTWRIQDWFEKALGITAGTMTQPFSKKPLKLAEPALADFVE